MPTRKRAETPLARLARGVDKIAAPACHATIVEHAEEPGKVFALLMACPTGSSCRRCADARARLWKPPAPAPALRPMPTATTPDEWTS